MANITIIHARTRVNCKNPNCYNPAEFLEGYVKASDITPKFCGKCSNEITQIEKYRDQIGITIFEGFTAEELLRKYYN